MSAKPIYPWLKETVDRFLTLSSLPAVSVFVGSVWGGIDDFIAYSLVKSCCVDPTSCSGTCSDCILLKSGSHPDIIHIGQSDIKEDLHSISIDDIRSLYGQLTLPPAKRERYVVIIHHADRLTGNAANALLKMLEDPTLKSHFWITVSHIDFLLPTIRSRVQYILSIPLPEKTVALDWFCTHFLYHVDQLDTLWYLSAGQPGLMESWLQHDIYEEYDALIKLCLKKQKDILICDEVWRLFKFIQKKTSYHDTVLVDFIIDSLIYCILNQYPQSAVSWAPMFSRLLNLKQYSRLSVNTRLIIEQLILFVR